MTIATIVIIMVMMMMSRCCFNQSTRARQLCHRRRSRVPPADREKAKRESYLLSAIEQPA